jgi:alpha-amylase/alpha-mannosidase (GH57 family)
MDLNLALFWHMHQPFYKDELTGEFLMPWVRLHSIKGYFDMINVLEDFPDVSVNINLVPSLVEQIEDYVHGTAGEANLKCFLKPAEELADHEKQILLRNFFMANWETMIKPHWKYWRLLQMRGLKYDPAIHPDEIMFSTSEYRDLQVWHNLTWFGFRALKKYPRIGELIEKGSDFTEEEKLEVYEIQQKIMARLVPDHRKFLDAGQVELTATPYFHPILPLVISTDLGAVSSPGRPLPRTFSHPEDARAQIQKAVEYFTETFGQPPRGMWPSEGSVCSEMAPMLQEAGIKWIATDEGVLFKTIGKKNPRGKLLYRPYKLEHQGHSVSVVFRDTGLSDLIGFKYQSRKPQAAVNDFIDHLRAIRKYLSKKGGLENSLVSVVLDGENPWEGYRESGREFLTRLYTALSQTEGIKTVRIGDFIESHPEAETLHGIHPGSWIGHNFNIWIGHEEENKAWELLGQTRDFLCNHVDKMTESERENKKDEIEKAWREIYIAEGSDWFWWYGDDFTTDNDAEFDNLFRTHLKNVYQLLAQPVPAELDQPITTFHVVEPEVKPVQFIRPRLDGKLTDFYEWHGAGIVSARRGQGAMYEAGGYIKQVHYGFNLEELYIRIDYNDPETMGFDSENLPAGENYIVSLHLFLDREYALEFPIDIYSIWGLRSTDQPPLPVEEQKFQLYAKEDDKYEYLRDSDQIATAKFTEIGVPFSEYGLESESLVEFAIFLYPELTEEEPAHHRADQPLERCPRKGKISFQLPDANFEMDNWFV